MNIHPDLAQATQLHQAGRLAEAEGHYLRFLEDYPADGIALYLLGILHGQRADFAAAAECLQKATEANPAHLDALLGLGNARFKLGQVTSALACYRQALEIDPKSFAASFGIGKCLSKLGDFRSAADHFRRALKAKPDFAECMFRLAEVLLLDGELDKALYTLQRCEKLRPDRPEIQVCLGRVHEARNKFKPAEDCYRKALEIDPRHVEAHWRLGDRLRAAGDLPGAVEYYRRAVSLNPRDIFAQARYGHGLLVSGSAEKRALITRLQTDHLYADAKDAAAVARELACRYGYDNQAANNALMSLLESWDPSQLYPAAWWQERLSSFGSPEDGHDRILRGVMSQVFSWSIPARETHERLASFIGPARLNSLGAGAGYWEYLLNRHFGIPVVASDIALTHRFIDVAVSDYASAPIGRDDVIFIAWIPAGEHAACRILERMVPGQKLILLGEVPDSAEAPLTCATGEFYARLMEGFDMEENCPLVRFSHMRDSISFLVKKAP